MINNICKICKKSFEILEKSQSHKEGTCSYSCLRKTGLVRLRLLKSALKKRNIEFSEEDPIKILEEKYSKIMSKITKKSTAKKHKTIEREHGSVSNFYKLSGQKSIVTTMKRFLIKNYISFDNNISKIELSNLYRFYFNTFTHHDEKIKAGRLNKYGNKENIVKSYKDGLIKTVRNFYKIDDESFVLLNEEQINLLIKKYKNDIKFYNYDPIKWKLSHLKKIGISTIALDNNVINKLYSEYLSKRFTTRSLHVISNGYKKSKKGWFKFSNIYLEYFYRSSWELKVLKFLDSLIKIGKVINVFEPGRIQYIYDNKNRHYYPDIGITLPNNNNIIIEIKPQSKLSDPINIAKFAAAKCQIQRFIILTENEIYTENLESSLLNGASDV